MDTSRISKIIVEAETKLSTLDEALDNSNRYAAHWTLLILLGMMQDLQRLAEEEPIPIQIDKRRLSETFENVQTVMSRLKLYIEEDNYRLASTDSVSLHSILYDMHEIINGEKHEVGLLSTHAGIDRLSFQDGQHETESSNGGVETQPS